ncbi:MAG: hypothetical protein ABFS38_22345 [Bacteroidota bacterium]
MDDRGIVLLSGIGSPGRDIIDYQVRNGLIDKKSLPKVLKRDANLKFLYDFNPLETIGLVNQPVLIIQGKSDRRVPYKDAYIITDESLQIEFQMRFYRYYPNGCKQKYNQPIAFLNHYSLLLFS